MADTESPDLGAAEESDLHPADPPDALRTAEYGRESAAAQADTSDDTPTPRETTAD